MRSLSPVQVAHGSVGDSTWEVATRTPCPLLQPYVRRLVGYDERSLSPTRQRQFPQPHVVVIIEFGPALAITMGGDERTTDRHPGGFVAAISNAYADTEHQGWQRGIQVDLTPTGARRFFDMPLSEMNQTVVALRDIHPEDHRHLADQLDACRDWSARFELIESLLARRILRARLVTTRVDWALARIEAAGGNLKVGSLSRELGCSQRHLISLFRDQVGIPPKQWARLVRLECVLKRVRTAKPGCFAELALAHGFSDQAHLARDVKVLTGLTTSQARENFSEILDLLR